MHFPQTRTISSITTKQTLQSGSDTGLRCFYVGAPPAPLLSKSQFPWSGVFPGGRHSSPCSDSDALLWAPIAPTRSTEASTTLGQPHLQTLRLKLGEGQQLVLKVLKHSFYTCKLMRATITLVVFSNSLSKASRKSSSIWWHPTTMAASPQSSLVSTPPLALPLPSHRFLKELDQDSPLTQSFPTHCTHLWSHCVLNFFSNLYSIIYLCAVLFPGCSIDVLLP